MAKLLTEGLDAMEKRMKDLSRDIRNRCIPEMLKAGADVLVQSWQDEILNNQHIRTGLMYEAVNSTDVRPDTNGASIEVYPQGTDAHRITHAQKAFILHYGRKPTKRGTKEIKGDKFVTKAEAAAKAKVDAAMQKVLDSYTSGKE